MDDERLVNIETKIAYQEHMISELNEVLFQQQKTMDELKRTVELLKGRLVDIGDMMSAPTQANEKPPHY